MGIFSSSIFAVLFRLRVAESSLIVDVRLLVCVAESSGEFQRVPESTPPTHRGYAASRVTSRVVLRERSCGKRRRTDSTATVRTTL
eukprot:845502-Prorocentrum_minimum.AAC.5